MQALFKWAATAVFALAGMATTAVAAPGTSAGVYTAAQAASGATVYTQRCALCHGKSGEGTWEVPPLTGRFMANWGKSSVAALADYVGRAMPQFAPGTLDAKDRTDVLAYLLQINGQPSGTTPLPEAGSLLATMTIDAVATPAPR
jgi:cytochrome c